MLLPNGNRPRAAAQLVMERVLEVPPMAEVIIGEAMAGWKKAYKLTTRRSILRDLRALLQAEGFSKLVGMCVISEAEQKQYQRGYARTLRDRHMKLRPLSACEFLNAAEEAASRGNQFGLVAALLALTGRRLHELWHTASFAPAPGRGKKFEWTEEKHLMERRFWTTFAGQAKGRDRDIPPFPIPLLAPYADVLEMFREFRKTGLTLNGWTRDELNKAIRGMFGDLDPGISAKDLRAAYSEVAAWCYRPASMSDSAFRAHVLGHRIHPAEDPDLETSISYVVYSVTQ